MRCFSIFFFLISLLITNTVFADVFSPDYQAFEGHRTTVHAIAFTHDGRYLVASGGKNEVIVWDTKTGKRATRGVENPQNKPLNYMALNDGATLIATVGFMDGAVKISRFSDGTLLRTIKAHSGEKSGLAFFPGSDLLVTAGIDEGNKVSLKLWNASTGRLVKILYRSTLPVSHEYISGLSFNSDGTRLACGISNKKHGIMIFDMKAKVLIKKVHYAADVSDVSFSPDGRFIAGGSTNKKVIIWNSATGRVVREMTGHNGFVSTVSFSPDGRYIASADMGYRNNFRLWDAATGRLVQVMAGRNQGINAVVFSPDGTSLAVGVITHGDLFKIDTVRLFSTAEAAQKVPWYNVTSGAANLKVSFPGEPEAGERYKSDRHYAYSRFQMTKGNSTYYLRVIEYKYRMNPSKARSQVEKTTSQLVSQGTRRGGRLVSSQPFSYRGIRGTDSLIVRETRGTTYRKRYRVIFIGNFLYEMKYSGTGKKESPGEKRFFESFGTMR